MCRLIIIPLLVLTGSTLKSKDEFSPRAARDRYRQELPFSRELAGNVPHAMQADRAEYARKESFLALYGQHLAAVFTVSPDLSQHPWSWLAKPLSFDEEERLVDDLNRLPAASQWGVAEKAALGLRPVYEKFIRQAAMGEVMHNDDTGMRILRLAREPADSRTGIFTSGIVSLGPDWKIALYFSGAKHAGENLAELLKRRPPGLAPLIQMCDALSWNTSHLPEGVERLLAHCMSHGRRQFVEVAENFPEECRYVLETLGSIWHHDALARERKQPYFTEETHCSTRR